MPPHCVSLRGNARPRSQSSERMQRTKCRSRPVSRVLSPPENRRRRTFLSDARCRAPPASRTRRLGRAARHSPLGETPPYSLLHQVGFAVPPPSPEARCALTAPFHPCHASFRTVRRFALCCTFLRVTPTGRWPAPCPVVPGLSSAAPSPADRRVRPDGSSEVDLTRTVGVGKRLPLSLPSPLGGEGMGDRSARASRGAGRGRPRPDARLGGLTGARRLPRAARARPPRRRPSPRRGPRSPRPSRPGSARSSR